MVISTASSGTPNVAASPRFASAVDGGGVRPPFTNINMSLRASARMFRNVERFAAHPRAPHGPAPERAACHRRRAAA